MKGYYFAERGGMFMAATLRKMARPKIVEAVINKDGEVISPRAIARLSGGEIHRFSRVRPRAYGLGGARTDAGG